MIAEEAGAIVFVEVKARRSRLYGTRAESAGARKRHPFGRLAVGYLARRGLGDRVCRFDIVEVWVDALGGQRWRLSGTRSVPEACRTGGGYPEDSRPRHQKQA